MDDDKTKEHLLSEIKQLQKKEEELEKLKIKHKATSEHLNNLEIKWHHILSDNKISIIEWDIVKDEIKLTETLINKINLPEKSSVIKPSEWYNMISKEDKEKYHNSIENIKSGGTKEFEIEYKISSDKNKLLYFIDNSKVIEEKNGVPQKILSILIDITSTKTVEQELHLKNEELSTTNEELETMNEEYEALNEDLLEVQSELIEKNDFISAITDSLPFGFLVYDFHNNHSKKPAYLNKKLFEITGLTEKDFEDDKRIYESLIVDPEQQKQVKESIENVISSKATEDIKWENIEISRKNGDTAFVDIQFIPLLKSDFLIMTFHDVTDKVDAKRALSESEEKFRTITEEIDDCIVLSLDEKTYWVNKTFAEKIEYRPEELIGKSYDFYFSGEDIKRIKNNLSDRLSGKDVEDSYEIKLKSKSGKTLDFDIKSKIITIDGRNVVLTVGRDITEKKASEQKIIESENLYQTIFENTGTASVILDIDRTILLANTEYEKLSGYSKEELEGKMKWSDFVVKEDLEMMVERHTKRRTEKDVIGRYEFRFIDRNKNIKNIFLSVALIPNSKKSIASLSDITELKHKEQRIKETDQHLEVALIGADLGFWDWNLKTNLRIYNPRLAEILGYTVDEIPKDIEWWKEQIHHEDRDNANQRMEKHFNQETDIYECEYRIRTKKQNYLWILNRGRTIELDINGKPVRMVGTILDITERKLVEQAVKRSSAQMRQIIDTVPHLIFAKNLNGEYILVNKATADLYNTTVDEMTGSHHRKWALRDDESEKMLSDDFEVIRSKKIKHIPEESLLLPDGKTVWLETTKVPFTTFGEDAVLGVSIDITERRKAETSLKESEERFRTIFEIARDSIFIKDEKFEYTHVNPEMEKILKKTSKEIIGKKDEEIFGRKAGIEIQNIDKRVFEGETIKYERTRIVNGKRITFLTIKVPIRDAFGKVTNLLGISRDITDIKDKENSLKEAKYEAERANQLKSEFLANMSHELRTPLNSIIGFCQIFRKYEFSKEDMLKYIDLIHGSGSHLLEIINDILDISKIESGKVSLDKEEIYLSEMLDEIHDETLPSLQNKDVFLDISIEDDVPAIIYTDYTKLKQILHNIVNNAIKFTPRGHIKINVKTPLISKQSNEPIEYLIFSVRDTGVGIPLEKQDVIFDSFVQADGSLTRRHGGTGLGLTICKNYVSVLGGKIWFESEPSKGTIFYFTIKIINNNDEIEEIKHDTLKEEFTEKNITEKKTEYSDEQNILLIEDDENAANMVKIIIEKLGYKLRIATNGEEGINLIKERKPDLILMDIQLPMMDGVETTKIIRSIDKYKDIPIIAMTAFAMKGDKQKFLEAGCDDYISKPIDIVELENKLIRQLQPDS